MKIESLQPGQIVYSIERGRLGNTTLRTVRIYSVRVIEVDAAEGRVVASWNSNRPQTYYRAAWSKWRKDKPMMIEGMMGCARLATREEIKASKAAERGNAP